MHQKDYENLECAILTKNMTLATHIVSSRNIKEEPYFSRYTFLHYAAEMGNANIIPIIINPNLTFSQYAAQMENSCIIPNLTQKLNQKLNAKSFDGSTPLHAAVKKGHSEVVKVLLKHRAIYTSFDQNQKTPLTIAIENGDFETFQIILDRFLFDTISKPQSREQMLNKLLYLSAAGNNSKIVELLLSYGTTPNYFSKVMGQTALHLACTKGNLQVISMLLNTKQCPINDKSNEGLTALHLAVKEGFSEVVSLLLERGASCNELDQDNKTALSFALENTSSDEESLPILLNHIRQTESTVENSCLLLKEDHLLLKYHNQSRNDQNENSILHLAVENQDETIVNLLLQHKACIHKLNKNGYTPFAVAIINRSLSIINLFLQSGEDPMSFFIPNDDVFLPLDHAFKETYTDVLELLFKSGIVRFLLKASTIRSAEWKKGYFLLYLAAYQGNGNIVKILLDNGVDPNANFEKYLTPLHAAAQQGNEKIVKLLLDHGAMVNPKRKPGFLSTPLLAASYSKHSRIVELLLNNGADFNVQLGCVKASKQYESSKRIFIKGSYTDLEVGRKKSLFRYTPLHFAVEAKDEKIVKLLLNYGAVVNSQSGNGAKPIGLAIEKEHIDIVRQLLSAGADVLKKHRNASILKIESLKTNAKMAEIIVKVISSLSSSMYRGKYSSPLGIAIDNNFNECVKILLKDPTYALFKHRGASALHAAVSNSNLEIVKMLLKLGVDIHLEDEDGNTALNIALFYDNENIVEHLLKSGASTDLKKFKSAFKLAIRRSNPHIVRKFLNYGASVHEPDENDELPIFNAIRGQNSEVVKFLLKKGVSWKTVNNEDTIFQFALENYCFKTEIFQVLMDYGVDVDTQDEEGNTPLSLILIKDVPEYFNKPSELLKLFLLNGSNPNELDASSGKTILELAVQKTDPECVKILLLNGADVNFFNEDKELPLKISFDSLLFTRSAIKHIVNFNFNDDWESVSKDLKSLPRLKIAYLLTQEVARRQAASGDIEEKNQIYVSSTCIKKYYEVCQREIELMKVTNICQRICYYDVLVANCSQLANFSRHDSVKLVLSPDSKVKELFTQYADFLIDRIEKGKYRRDLMDSSYVLLKKALRFNFPPLIVEHVFSFLENRDLRNLSSAFKTDMYD